MDAPQVTVGVLHPGSMGSAVAAAVRGARVLWCPAGRSAATAERARSAGLTSVPELADLLATSDVVLSICPPAAAEDLASQVAALRYRGVFVEANAISRERMLRIADRITEAGGDIVDGSIIGPPPVDGASARLYLAGPAGHADAVAALFDVDGPVEVVRLGEPLGRASALKMAFAGYQKATRLLAALAHALAARYGVTDALLAEADRLTRSPLVEPHYLPSVAARAWRWEPEMHEVADILAAEGLPDDLALAAATVLERWEPDRDSRDLPLPVVLEQLHDQPG